MPKDYDDDDRPVRRPRRDEEYDDDDRPRRPRRRDDDEDEDERPRRSRRRNDAYEDRPRRRRRRSSRGSGSGPLDGMYSNTNLVVLILFGVCCNWIAFILSLVAFITAKDSEAKSKSMITMIVALIVAVLVTGARMKTAFLR